MNKRYRRAFFSGVLLLSSILVISTIVLLVFIEKEPHTTYPASLNLLKGKYPVQHAIKIMPLGDSITFGVGSKDLGGYREPLWEKMEASDWNVRFVGSMQSGPASLPQRDNEGHSGWRIDQISAKVVPWLQAAQPQIVLLHIGTNDILQGYSPAVAEARLNYLLEQISSTLPEAHIIVAQIVPLNRPGRNPDIIAYNAAIPGIVRNLDERGQHISYVDMYHAIPINDLVDGIHPDVKGYALMANVWYAALKPLVAA